MSTTPPTEAEALLRSGALYPMRLGLQGAAGPLVFAGFKHGAFSLYFGDAPIVHHDLEGRWRWAFLEPTHYLKGLDGTVRAVDRPRRGRHLTIDRRLLSEAESAALDATIRGLAIDLFDRLESGAIEPIDPPLPGRRIGRDRLVEMLGRVLRWDVGAWSEHRRRHRSAYGPLPFIPPDCQNALVLQATIGSRRCRTFGGIPAGLPEGRTLSDFSRHCRRVAELLGEGLIPIRHLYLAGPDALRRPSGEVEELLRIAAESFPLATEPAPARWSEWPIDRPHREGFQAFLDDPEPPLPGAEALRRFRSLGLRRVTIGIESGAGSLPPFVCWPHPTARSLVADLKAAGIAVSIAALLGPRGVEHDRETIDLLGSLWLSLGHGDHVYLVDAHDLGGMSTDGGPTAEDRPLLSPEELRRQERRFLDRLAPLRADRRVKVLPYLAIKQAR